MKVPNETQREFSGANMTPMIDVVFLLIIFFLVSSHLARQENRLPVDLPTAATHQPLDVTPVDLTITVDADGRWLAAGRTVQAEQLQGMLDALVREHLVMSQFEFGPTAQSAIPLWSPSSVAAPRAASWM